MEYFSAQSGFNLFLQVKDSPEFKLVKDACREALLRAQQQNREATALQKEGKSEEMTKGQRNYINGLHLVQQQNRKAIALQKESKFEEMTKGQRKYIGSLLGLQQNHISRMQLTWEAMFSELETFKSEP
jgi:hypothetical protein